MTDSTAQSELDLLAFRYTAGELTADETQVFEQRLEHDQAAREAVEHAVLTHEAVSRHADTAGHLNLLAFRYAHDELSAGATDAFERRLEHDAAACEAVQHAVLVTEAVHQHAAARTPQTPVLARIWPLAGAIAAALAMAFLLPVTAPPSSPNANTTAMQTDEPEALIASWLEMATVADNGDAPAFEPLGETASLEWADREDEGVTPSWLLQALDPQM